MSLRATVKERGNLCLMCHSGRLRQLADRNLEMNCFFGCRIRSGMTIVRVILNLVQDLFTEVLEIHLWKFVLVQELHEVCRCEQVYCVQEQLYIDHPDV